MENLHPSESEIAAGIGHRIAQARDAERLAWRAAGHKIERPHGLGAFDEVRRQYIAKVHAVGKARIHDGGRERLDLRVPYPVILRPGHFRRSDA